MGRSCRHLLFSGPRSFERNTTLGLGILMGLFLCSIIVIKYCLLFYFSFSPGKPSRFCSVVFKVMFHICCCRHLLIMLLLVCIMSVSSSFARPADVFDAAARSCSSPPPFSPLGQWICGARVGGRLYTGCVWEREETPTRVHTGPKPARLGSKSSEHVWSPADKRNLTSSFRSRRGQLWPFPNGSTIFLLGIRDMLTQMRKQRKVRKVLILIFWIVKLKVL